MDTFRKLRAVAPVSLYKCTGNPSFPGSPLQWEACPLLLEIRATAHAGMLLL